MIKNAMPSCVMKRCKNSSKLNNKSNGVTFHLFPTNWEINTKWVEAVRTSRKEPQWQPSKSSVVCSDHFYDNDLYKTNCGLCRVSKTGYPKKNLCYLNNVENNSAMPCTASAFGLDLPETPNGAPSEESLVLLSNVVVEINLLSSTSETSNADLSSDSLDGTRDVIPLPHMVIDDTLLPRTSSDSDVDTPSTSKTIDDSESIYDTPISYKLRNKLTKQERRNKMFKKKIKTLQQTVRRLKNRNRLIKNVILELKKIKRN